MPYFYNEDKQLLNFKEPGLNINIKRYLDIFKSLWVSIKNKRLEKLII